MLRSLNVHINSPDENRRYLSGGLIICEKCQRILGYLNKVGYRDIKMVLYCRCGQIGFLKTDFCERQHSTEHSLRTVKNEYRCEKCGTPLFSLCAETVANYAFTVTCRCGERYRRNVRDLEETVKKNKKLSLIKNKENF